MTKISKKEKKEPVVHKKQWKNKKYARMENYPQRLEKITYTPMSSIQKLQIYD